MPLAWERRGSEKVRFSAMLPDYNNYRNYMMKTLGNILPALYSRRLWYEPAIFVSFKIAHIILTNLTQGICRSQLPSARLFQSRCLINHNWCLPEAGPERTARDGDWFCRDQKFGQRPCFSGSDSCFHDSAPLAAEQTSVRCTRQKSMPPTWPPPDADELPLHYFMAYTECKFDGG